MYNSFSALPVIPYNIMKFLTQDEIIWKLLAYNDYEALSHDSLTFDEKMDMLWKVGPQEQYSVFLSNLIEDVIAESKTILKCYHYYSHADNLYTSSTVFAFDVLYGGQMALVDYNGIPVSRGDLMLNRIMDNLNGAYVGGVGQFMFYDDMSRYDLARSVIGNSKSFTGKQIFLSVIIGDTGREVGCGG